MGLLLLGLAMFMSTHVFAAVARGPRAALIDRLGENGFKGLYSLIALAGMVLIYRGWREADASVIYATPYWMRHAVSVLMLASLVFLVAAYAPKGRIAAVAKHPMLVAVKIWAFSHLLVNGEVRSLIVFGAFLAFAVIDRIAVKRRGEPTPEPGPWTNDLIVAGVALAAFFAIYYYLHPYIAGVPLSF